MDERIEKAFDVANYMATLSNQRRILLEEFKQKLVYYINGGTFNITPELISFTKMTLEMGHTDDVSFIDSNTFPVIINDVQVFFDDIVSVYFQSVNDYSVKYADIKNKRSVQDIVDL